MSREYYYLVSSLPELIGHDEGSKHPYPVFFDFCREELDPVDLRRLNLCSLFNDIVNVCNYRDENDDYTSPSFYKREEFEEALVDNDLFFPFIQEFLDDESNGARRYPKLVREDELLWRMFERIEELDGGGEFIEGYFRFELHNRNMGIALSHRALSEEYSDLIITADFISERIAQSTSQDFGLGGEIGEFEPIFAMYGKADPIEIEHRIEEIRWKWLDETVGYRVFSPEAVFTFGIKLKSVERWLELTPERGRSMLDTLIRQAQTQSDSEV